MRKKLWVIERFVARLRVGRWIEDGQPVTTIAIGTSNNFTQGGGSLA
jgi:hypothetical protein